MNHLSACMDWLMRAQEVNDTYGVSAMYYRDEQSWEVDYPETTGYIIPTFLAYAEHTSQDLYLKKAIAMGDWLCDMQLTDGGIGDLRELPPLIFNTSQVILGWVALYMKTFDKWYLNAAIKAADWIISKQYLSGNWVESTYAGAKAYHIRVAWALMELSYITEDDKHIDAAKKSFYWVVNQANEKGWFRNNSLTDGQPWTHLIGYALVGFLKVHHINVTRAMSILSEAVKGITKPSMGVIPGTLDSNWHSKDKWSCLTGNAQLSFFLHAMGKTDESDDIVNELKLLQLADKNNRNTYGGLLGSYPIDGGYMPNIIPNWGVKFFADCLLQRTNVNQRYLG